jgi:hypothetical protein
VELQLQQAAEFAMGVLLSSVGALLLMFESQQDCGALEMCMACAVPFWSRPKMFL